VCGLFFSFFFQVHVTGIECASEGSDTHDCIYTVVKDDVMHAVTWATALDDALVEDMQVGHVLMYRLP
jgi:hypothetical protein